MTYPTSVAVLKFLAAVNPWRDPSKRVYEIADLRTVYLAVGREELDETLVMKLAGGFHGQGIAGPVEQR